MGLKADGDGLSDGDEVRWWRTDPTLADTDGDGLPDAMSMGYGFTSVSCVIQH